MVGKVKKQNLQFFSKFMKKKFFLVASIFVMKVLEKKFAKFVFAIHSCMKKFAQFNFALLVKNCGKNFFPQGK